jgi:hypothetical protein
MSETTVEQSPILEIALPTSQFLRCIHAVVFVGTWMAIGWLFHLNPNSYLAVGVPLVVVFQVFVRKKPLVTLWIRNAEHFRLNGWGMVLGLGLAILPVARLVQICRMDSWRLHTPQILWLVCCIAGCFAAAFAFCQFNKRTLKELGVCMATAGVIGSGIMVLGALVRWASAAQADCVDMDDGEHRRRKFSALCAGVFCFGRGGLSRRN